MHSRKCRKCSNFLSSFQLIGMSECQTRIKQLVDDAKQMAGLPQDTTLEGLVSVPTGRTFPRVHFCVLSDECFRCVGIVAPACG